MGEELIIQLLTDRETSVNFKYEKNTRGSNYSVTVIGAATPEEAVQLAKETIDKAKETFEEE